MAKLEGSQLFIEVGSSQINDLTNVGFTSNNVNIECTNYDSAGFRELLQGTTTWSMTATGYEDADATYGLDELMASHLAKTTVAVDMTTGVTGDLSLSGNAFVASVERSGELDGVVEWNVTLEGTGTLTQTTIA